MTFTKEQAEEKVRAYFETCGFTLWTNYDLSRPDRRNLAVEWMVKELDKMGFLEQPPQGDPLPPPDVDTRYALRYVCDTCRKVGWFAEQMKGKKCSCGIGRWQPGPMSTQVHYTVD